MVPSTTASSAAGAGAPARTLVSQLEAERDTLADTVVERIRDAVPGFRTLPRTTLRRAVVDTLGRGLAARRDVRAPTPLELDGAAAIGRQRAEQGLSLDAALHAHRVAVGVL